MRISQELSFDVSRKRVLYIMTKTFRIRNNYSLQEAVNYQKRRGLQLQTAIIEPQEESRMAFDFFRLNSSDLLERLQTFNSQVFYLDQKQVQDLIHDDIEAIFMDFSYLRADIRLFNTIMNLANDLSINLFQVESNIFVPIKDASDHEEYGAFTIRRKIHKLMPYYESEVLSDARSTIGEKKALKLLDQFIEKKLPFYAQHHDPSKQYTSRLSTHLKFGFISPVTIYHILKPLGENVKRDFLEQLIVRRELAYNYVYYNPNYDKFSKMTEKWAYRTMKDHASDTREYVYSISDYVHFKTHDPYFNAAMKEMVYKGYMHNYMRMYWAKKIIEWSKTYKEAYDTIIKLNNRYLMDGLTPNGYAGVAWCFGKHDRPWRDIKIFGKLRYMNDNGLRKKFDIDLYVKHMDFIEKESK